MKKANSRREYQKDSISSIVESTSQEALEFLRISDVMARLKIGRTKVYELIKSKQLAAPIKLGSSISIWLASDVKQYMNNVIKKARGEIAND